jgi:hypothetical protein
VRRFDSQQDLPVSVNHATLTSAAIVDVAANIICIYGLQLVGSGMYQVILVLFLSAHDPSPACILAHIATPPEAADPCPSPPSRQVLYSSVVLFAALMTRFILGKEVQVRLSPLLDANPLLSHHPHTAQHIYTSRPIPKEGQHNSKDFKTRTLRPETLGLLQSMQWLGIIIMAIGLATTSIGGHLHHSNVKEQLDVNDDEMVHIMYGVVVTAVGCIGYASSYVLGEYVLSKSPTLPP